MAADVQVSLHPLLERGETKLFEMSDLRLCPGFECEIRECRPSPESEGFSQVRGPFAGCCLSRRLDKTAKAFDIELSRLDPEAITRRLGLQPVGAELLSQLRDEVLQRGLRCARRLLPPERIQQRVC